MRTAAVLTACLVPLVSSSVAAARDAPSGEVAALAARAASDAGALATLRSIDRVDGRPVDLRAALDVSGPALAARLRVLASTAAARGRAGAIADPRGSAKSILSDRRFTGSSVPRPLHRPLRWIGDHIRRAFDWVSAPLPGGGDTLWLLIGIAIVAAAAYSASRLAARRGGRAVEGGARSARPAREDPRGLEREADAAEHAGDFERAVRLRFRAGLLRLADAEAIPSRQSLTNGEIERTLSSPSFTRLAGDFDEIVYGGRLAVHDDAARAHDRWPRVLDEARR